MIRLFLVLLVCVPLVSPGCSWAQSANDADAMASRLAPVAASSFQVIPAVPGPAATERWIVWDNGFGDHQAVTLALCRRDQCSWRHAWADAYGPTIQYMGDWSAEGEPVFLLLFSQGAEAQSAVVIGHGKDRVPVVLDEVDAAAIAVSPRVGGLEINASSGVPERWTCEGWDKARRRFRVVQCR